METMGPTEARIYVPHGILLFQFRIHGKYKVSWIIYKANKIEHMHNMYNLGINLTYMREEESSWSQRDTWTRFPSSMATMMKML